MKKNLILAAAAAATLLGAGAATSASAMPVHGGGHGPVVHTGFRGGGAGFRSGFRGGRAFPASRGEFGGYHGGWARGGFWPRGYGVLIADPIVYGLYAAPYGYEWMQGEDGSMVLVAIGSGLIADVVIR
ncbi:MAG TPA: RcnB family protein [Caulobacteraceae bacterium]